MLKPILAAALLVVGGQAAISLVNLGSDEGCVGAAGTQTEVVEGSDVIAAMRLGWWGCAEALAEAAASTVAASSSSSSTSQPTGVNLSDLQNLVALEARAIAGRISALRSSLESSRPPSQVISPAFQWAQSPDKVFLNVKFSHKIDAPATLDVVVDSVELSENKVSLRATKERKAFVLDLPLRGVIDPDQSTWSLASVGRVVFTLKKKKNKAATEEGEEAANIDGSDDDSNTEVKLKWSSLLAKGAPKPNQMHHWWDRQSEFQKELDSLPDDDDDDDDEDDKRGNEKKTKKKQSATKETQGSKKGKKGKKEKKGKSASKKGSSSSNESAAGSKFVRDALKAIEVEKALALEEVNQASEAKKAVIESEAVARKKELAAETAVEKKRVEAEFSLEAEAVAWKDQVAEMMMEGSKKMAGKEEVATTEQSLASNVEVHTFAAPGKFEGKQGSHAPTLTVTPVEENNSNNNNENGEEGKKEEGKKSIVVSVSVAHPSMTAEHQVEFVWVAMKGQEATPEGVLAVKKFEPREAAAAKTDEQEFPALSVTLPLDGLVKEKGEESVVELIAFASCNLHGIWASEPTSVVVPAPEASSIGGDASASTSSSSSSEEL